MSQERIFYIKDNIYNFHESNEYLYCQGYFKYPKTPLRYPGGKQHACKKILILIPSDIDRLVSPFAGGCSIEIAVSHFGKKVRAYDNLKPLVEFFKWLKKDPHLLHAKCLEHYPIDKNKFNYLKQNIDMYNGVDLAASFFTINRSSFSGSSFSGGYSPGANNIFTKSSIDYLLKFKSNNLSVFNNDFEDTITKNSDDFLYLDPPYMIKNNLYGKNGQSHKNFNHEKLFNLLKNRKKWIMSYNDCNEIRDIYKGFEILPIQWTYKMSENKNSKEIIIRSPDNPDISFNNVKKEQKTPIQKFII